MPKWLKWLLQLIAIFSTSLFPIGYILIKYGIADTELREVRVGGINAFWIIVITVIVALFVFWVLNGLMIKWKEDIKKKPFGSKSRLFQQIALLFIMVVGIYKEVIHIKAHRIANTLTIIFINGYCHITRTFAVF